MWTSTIFKSEGLKHGGVFPERANKVLMGWIWNMFWHSYSILIPLTASPSVWSVSPPNHANKNVSLTTMQSRTECWSFYGRRCGSLQGDDTFREKCFMPQGMIWMVHCWKRWSDGEALDLGFMKQWMVLKLIPLKNLSCGIPHHLIHCCSFLLEAEARSPVLCQQP